jgi:hypothetical protein
MLSASQLWSALELTASLFFVALCACSSAENPNLGTISVTAGAAATAPSSPGVAGASGRAATGTLPPGAIAAAGTTSTMTGGSSGTAAMSGSASGGSSAAASAGTGGRAGVAGSIGAGVGGSTSGSGGMTGAAGAAGASSTATATCGVAPITDDLRSRYQNMNDPYYQKYADANGIIVATGSKVDDQALVRYCRLLSEMISNAEVRQAVIADKMWFTMIDDTEQLSSLPQISKAYGTSLNQRARGLGGLTPTICAEDSIMCMPGDRWKGDCICPHETGHTLYSSGIAKVPDLSKRLTAITNSVKSSGRLANAYVWEDGNESGMMAWGVQAWYDCAIDGTNGAYHSDINTRAELQKELPEFYQLLSELMPVDSKYDDCYSKP